MNHTLSAFLRLGDNLRLRTVPRLSPTNKIGYPGLKTICVNWECFFWLTEKTIFTYYTLYNTGILY